MTATRAGRPVQESATARLSRLLTMVPWLLARQGVDVDVAAAQFGVSREQLESDLALLFVCGTPGHLPDDLIEAQWEDGRVYVGSMLGPTANWVRNIQAAGGHAMLHDGRHHDRVILVETPVKGPRPADPGLSRRRAGRPPARPGGPLPAAGPDPAVCRPDPGLRGDLP